MRILPYIFWNPYTKVAQNQLTGKIDIERTDEERVKRGLPTPWSKKILFDELEKPPVY